MNYTGFSITWNETLSGVTVGAPCTGDNLNGKVDNFIVCTQVNLINCTGCSNKVCHESFLYID